MNSVGHLLLITTLSIPTTTLVLRSGDRIGVESPVRVESGKVLFRSGGGFYSVPTEEVDLDATREAALPAPARGQVQGRLKVTREERERLLRDLEQNHTGVPASPGALNLPPGPTPEERQQSSAEEWTWRRQARGYEETIRRAQEDIDLLESRAEALKNHIAGLLALGYKPNQFSYDTTQLAFMLDQIPRAQLEVQRAQRAYDQFRDDARRQGVTPGWLR